MKRMQKENVFAIDLLWLRVGKVGGSESFIRNLMDGMRESSQSFHAVLLVSEDNQESFRHYGNDERFELECCPVCSANLKQRMYWQNFHMGRFLRKRKISKCLEPVYSTPFLGTAHIKFYTVIHDLQAHHFPEYFSKARYLWMHLSWKNTLRKAWRVIAISEYDREDILSVFRVDPAKLVRIYNPVVVRQEKLQNSEALVRACGAEPGRYFFCVTSLLAHKNVETLIRIMKQRRDSYQLLICGVGGPMEEQLEENIRKECLEKRIILLPFVSDETRDALYRNCRIFLFPSVFEGFGMPPVEALLAGKTVITTRCTSIPEVTRGEAEYVDNPYDESEWNQRIDEELAHLEFGPTSRHTISSGHNPYSLKETAEQYLSLLGE